MKVQFPKSYFIDRIKDLDTRAKRLTPVQLDRVLDDGFAELATIDMFFSGEEIIPMDTYYEGGETKITIDVDVDVTGVYDLYLTDENQAIDSYTHGIRKIRDENSVYRDNRYNGRVHIDLANVEFNVIVENCVIKYFFTPSSANDFFYMDQQTRLALESAMGAALYERLQDTESSGRKRAAMTRQAKAIIPLRPADLIDAKKSLFPSGF